MEIESKALKNIKAGNEPDDKGDYSKLVKRHQSNLNGVRFCESLRRLRLMKEGMSKRRKLKGRPIPKISPNAVRFD